MALAAGRRWEKKEDQGDPEASPRHQRAAEARLGWKAFKPASCKEEGPGQACGLPYPLTDPEDSGQRAGGAAARCFASEENLAGQAFAKSWAHEVSSLPRPKEMRPSGACAPQPRTKAAEGTRASLPGPLLWQLALPSHCPCRPPRSRSPAQVAAGWRSAGMWPRCKGSAALKHSASGLPVGRSPASLVQASTEVPVLLDSGDVRPFVEERMGRGRGGWRGGIQLPP